MIKKYLLLLLLVYSKLLFSQDINFSILNSSRIGFGKSLIDEALENNKHIDYMENLTDLRIFKGNFTLGLRYLVDNPPEYGVRFLGIKKRFLEYNSDMIRLKAGNQSALFGRGLVLNLFENRNLGYDSEIDGINFQYQNNLIKATLIGGEINFLEPSTIFFDEPRYEIYNIKAGNIEVKPIKNLLFGGSYLWNKAKTPDNMAATPEFKEFDVENFELYGRYNFGFLDFFINYANKRTIINGFDSSKGSAFYTTINHTGNGYGISIEYKNYSYDIQDPNISQSFRDTRMLSYLNPPTLVKEHSYTLLTRTPHITDFNDEVGFQFDAFISIINNLNLNINYSISSKHYAYEINDNFEITKKEKGKTFLPSFENERSPFNEFFAEFEYSFDDYSSFLKIAFDRRVLINYSIFNPLLKVQEKKLMGIPILLQLALDEKWGLKFSSENLWIMEFPETEYHYDQLFSLQLSYSPIWSIGARIEYTTYKYEHDNKKFYIISEASYRLLNDHLITFSYGEERGGQVCSNGICRQIFPFNGFRFTITSYFK